MDHSAMGMSSMSEAMMIPYLHFSGGDYLWLNAWAPSSRGEIAAACIGLVVMAMLERFIAATRTMFDLHWHIRALAIDTAGHAFVSYSATGAEKQAGTRESQPHPVSPSSSKHIEPQKRGSSPSVPPRLPHLRTVPPFIPGHDIPRGILFAFQMFIGYLLMLAVMTFQAAYLISIVLGLGIGETLFGRVSRAGVVH